MRLLPALLNLSLMTTMLVIAFRFDWTLYEFALLVVYDAALIALLALLARPLQAVLTVLALGDGELATSVATLMFALATFFLLAIDVGMATGLQAISTLPARSDALLITTAWAGLSQGVGIAVAARALQLLLAIGRATSSPRLRSWLAAAMGTLVLLATSLLAMLIDDLAASTLVAITCLLLWQAGGWLALRG